MTKATVYVSRSEEDTNRFAALIAGLLKAGDVVFLKGPLGAGKTFFIRAAARELGVLEPVTSPSFTMGQTYKGRLAIHHLDLYRLAAFTGEDLIDFEPFFSDDAITFIEWPKVAEHRLEAPVITVELKHLDEHSRRITVLGREPKVAVKLEALLAGAGD